MENNVIPIERAIMKIQGRPRNSVVPRGKLIKEARLRYESNREKFARGLKHSMSPVTVAGIEQSKPSSPNKIKQVIEPLGLKYEDVIEINSGTPNADVRLIGADKPSTNSKTFKCSELNNLEFGELCSHMSFYLMFMEDLAARDDDKWMKDDPGAFGLPNSLTTVRSYITEKEKTPEIESALEGLENALVAMLRNPAANTRSGSSLLEAYHSEPPLEEHLQTLDGLGVKVVGAIYDFWTTIYTGLAAFQMLETNKEVANDFPDMLLHHPWKRLAMVVFTFNIVPFDF